MAMNTMRIAGIFLIAVFLSAVSGAQPVLTDAEKSIVAELRGLRKVSDDQRGEETKRLAVEIRKLPADGAKLGLASGLANLATEGDFGHETLQEVATTLADALQAQPASTPDSYLELAQLVRYENVHVAVTNAEFKAALAKLEMQDRDRQQGNFTLTDLQGRQWTLKDLQNHVVLVNFWATWCPPCRKEMPDLDALYQQYKDQGLVILAISDEEPAKVSAFLAAHSVTYPILLDPGRKVNEQFHVEGIPKSFVYDKQGNLAAQAIDMRTRGQFVELLKRAGLRVAQ
jgi:peroxiredoxin